MSPHWITRTGLLSLAASVALLAGCANDSGVTAPDAGSSASLDASDWNTPDTHAALKGKAPKGTPGGDRLADSLPETPDVAAALKTVTISALEGGTMQFGRVGLSFPPGALTEDTEISILCPVEGEGKVDFELYPHGLQFQVPVTLVVYLGGMGLHPLEDVNQYWWNEDTGDWVDIGGVWAHPIMVTPLDHFSRYKTGRVGW